MLTFDIVPLGLGKACDHLDTQAVEACQDIISYEEV